MIDPTVATTALMFVATEIGKGVVGEAGKSLWQGMVVAYERWRGKKPEPTDIDAPTARAMLGATAELSELAQVYFRDTHALRRAQTVGAVMRGARILWIDDHPEGNVLERRTLTDLGATVVAVETTSSAIASLQSDRFDLVLSDIARGESRTEGIDALPQLRAIDGSPPVVYYVMTVQGGVPRDAFGITASPSELLHLCLDVLERSRL